jgi:hypothetical protein
MVDRVLGLDVEGTVFGLSNKGVGVGVFGEDMVISVLHIGSVYFEQRWGGSRGSNTDGCGGSIMRRSHWEAIDRFILSF